MKNLKQLTRFKRTPNKIRPSIRFLIVYQTVIIGFIPRKNSCFNLKIGFDLPFDLSTYFLSHGVTIGHFTALNSHIGLSGHQEGFTAFVLDFVPFKLYGIEGFVGGSDVVSDGFCTLISNLVPS